mgnify:CR=1 FL=1
MYVHHYGENVLNEFSGGDVTKNDELFSSFAQEVEDIAYVVLFLCRDESSNITTQNLAVDGGYIY